MIQIDVYADIACPWCYIGSHRLQTAINARPDWQISRRWQPFQLQPDIEKGKDWKTFADAKFGGWQQALASFDHVRQAASDTDIHFDLEGIASAANTLDAHRLILFARDQEKEWAMAETLFRAFFSESVDLNDPAEMRRLAEAVGLEGEAAATMLAGDEYIDEVETSQQRAYELGIHGVPFYVLNDRFAIRGAQPAEVFLEAFDQIGEGSAARI